MRWTWIVALVVALISFTVALQNSEPVTVRFLAWQAQGPMALVALAMFLAGLGTGALAMLPAVLRRSREIGRLRRGPEQGPPSSPTS